MSISVNLRLIEQLLVVVNRNREWTQIDANKAFVQVVNKSLSAVLTEVPERYDHASELAESSISNTS